MLELHVHAFAGRAIRTKLVGDHHARRARLFTNEFAQQPFGSVFIASRLDQHIKNKAVLIDGAPEPMFLAIDRNDNLVKMPFVAELRRTLADFFGEVASEFLGPTPNRFMTDDDAARGQKIFNHRRLSGKRKYSQTAWAITSAGKRWPR